MSIHLTAPVGLTEVVDFVENVSGLFIRRKRESWHVETDFWGEHVAYDKTRARFKPNEHVHAEYRRLCDMGLYRDLLERSDEFMARVKIVNSGWMMIKTDIINTDLMGDILNGQYLAPFQTNFVVTAKRGDWNDHPRLEREFKPFLNAALREFEMRASMTRLY